ncbi:hypothetical protein DSL64_20660 [Dyadobacter luteus]|jgi:outer membrane biogenesis lipoprotein LolB|uniref:Heavy metal binding domain-containing protein n=1 Tax=Dyadobacter luteus TaxID=2259619 RepID=A0A3D8Y9X4_9BACT|nr:heavy metal-binding domain-containing protein [Dyadobacter luteus]REA58501.1 hypothetical protein DSL64_20660 [Dyadobacter luteus]
MNKLIYASMILLLTACAGNTEKTEKSETTTEAAHAKAYACPMKCEGDKTYEQAGSCPVCKMELQEVAMAEADSTGHVH